MTSVSSKRNLSIECCKMLCALIVVIMHVPLPDPFHTYLVCAGEFANSVFFAITGYFNYRATPSQLRRRFLHIVRLYLTAWFFHLFWGCVIIELGGGSTIAHLRASIPDSEEIIRWLVWQQDSFLAPLWFLASTGICYLILWGYTQFSADSQINYRPLYQTGLTLYLFFFTFAFILPLAEIVVPYRVFQNAWFLGLPMFSLGMFIHEHQPQIITRFKLDTPKILLIILLGCVLSVFHLRTGLMTGSPLGFHITTVGIILFVAEHPDIPCLSLRAKKIISKFGVYSTGIYLFHVTVSILYGKYLSSFTAAYIGNLEAWLRPFIVYLVSLAFAILWDWATVWVSNRRSFLKHR